MNQQIIQPKLNVVGVAGWCLAFVEDVFNAPHIAPNAITAWNQTQYKHYDDLPDVSVPLWFTWKDDGHVAVWIPGKGILSSPVSGTGSKWYTSISAIEKNMQLKYLGWSEDISNLRVVGVQKMTNEQAQELSLYIRLLAFESVDQANSHNADDVAHILADPAYAPAIAKTVYQGEWQNFAYKAGQYDSLINEVRKAKIQADELLARPTKESLISLQQTLASCVDTNKKLDAEKQDSVKTGNAIVRFIADWWNSRKK